MSEIRVSRATLLSGKISVPGDKSISHRAAMLAALADGPCEITGFLPSEDCLSTLRAMEALGARVEYLDADSEIPDDDDFLPTQIRIHGTGMELSAPETAIDCGNSGTTMRLLSGILAAQPFTSVLTGDASLSVRPMGRVIEPLEKMGASIEASPEGTPPLTIRGNPDIESISYPLPVASAQVKSAVLLAGLFAEGTTTVIEPSTTRDHTERMLDLFRVKTEREAGAISIQGKQILRAQSVFVPGDISSAAFWLVAAAAQSGSKLTVHGVGLNPTRNGILKVLAMMGCDLTETIQSLDHGEPFGDIAIKGCALQGVEIGGDMIANVIDELPVLAVAGALAQGTTVIRDAAELRVKETDRIAAVAGNLRAFGVDVKEAPDGMTIHGGSRLKGATVESFGDHRIAMAFAIAGLHADGETVIKNSECVATSYPNFEMQLKKFQSHHIHDYQGLAE